MVLIFSTPCSLASLSKRRIEVVEHLDRAGRAEASRQRHEALEVREQHRGFGEAFGDRLVGVLLQPLDDLVGQDVAQERLGLGFGPSGEAEGVIGDGGRDPEGGERRGQVELGEKARRRGTGKPGRKPEPGRDVEREAGEKDRGDQPDALEPEHGKADRRPDHEIELDPGGAPEERDKAEQAGILRRHDQHRAGGLAVTMGKRHAKGRRDDAEIDRDRPAVGDEILERVGEGEESREDRDQIRHRVEDHQPPPHLRGIALRAALDEAQDERRPAPGRARSEKSAAVAPEGHGSSPAAVSNRAPA